MKKILVIDDSRAYLSVVKQLLCDSCEVSLAATGAEAQEFLSENSADLILLDINMPEPDGAAILKKIRSQAKNRDVPVILAGQLQDLPLMARLLDEGAEDYVTKPFIPNVLLSRISRALELSSYRRGTGAKMKRSDAAALDALTGLWNRTYCGMKISQFLAEDSNTAAMLLVNVDNFRAVNDKLGHIIGDTVLKVISDMLSEEYPDDIIGRTGGDEFVLLIRNPLSKEEVADSASSMMKRVNAELEEITAGLAALSVGISQSPRDGRSFSELYDNAGRALYLVKSSGKHSLRFYEHSDSVMSGKRKTRRDAETDIRILQQQIREQGRVSGAYWQEYEPFVNIYRFIDREIIRTGKTVYIALLTVYGDGNYEPSDSELRGCMEKLYAIIIGSLRKGDVFTQYSSSQYIILLTGVDSEKSGIRVSERIAEVFENLYAETRYKLKCETTLMNGDDRNS